MAVMERFLQEVRVGAQVELIFGQKEIAGTVTELDREIVRIRKADGRTATVDLAAVSYYEVEAGPGAGGEPCVPERDEARGAVGAEWKRESSVPERDETPGVAETARKRSLAGEQELSAAIACAAEQLEQAKPEERLPALKRLERLYERALYERCRFDGAAALRQMFSYTRQSASLRARLCYIWILADTGNTGRAGELLSLIPDGAPGREEERPVSDEPVSGMAEELSGRPYFSQEEERPVSDEPVSGMAEVLPWDAALWSEAKLVETIVDRYFSGQKPALSDCFAALVKQDTLCRLAEHVKKFRGFVRFSPQEEKLRGELTGSVSCDADVTEEAVRTVIIKIIYGNPTGYRFWLLYLQSIGEHADPALLYSVNTALWILGPDAEAQVFRDQAAYLLETNRKVGNRYGAYRLYNRLYRLYLTKAWRRNPAAVKQLSSFAMDSGKLFQASPFRTKLAQDYIHLLRLLDDRDDYIYIKSAMFLATNNGCERYFYGLFRDDLLRREPALCVRMCAELLGRKKGAKDFGRRVLSELGEANPDYAGVTELLLAADRRQLPAVCGLLRDYPAVPGEEAVEKLLGRAKTVSAKLALLERIDACYTDALTLKRRLLHLYKKVKNRGCYESMYQTALCIVKNTVSEEELYELCRLAMLLATAEGRKNRTSDVVDIYERKSPDGGRRRELSEFCAVCGLYELPGDQACGRLFDALIAGDWQDFFAKYGARQLTEWDGIGTLLSCSGLTFVQQALDYLVQLGRAGKERESRQFADELDAVSGLAFGGSLREVTELLSDMPGSAQARLVQQVNYAGKTYPFYAVPEDETIVKILLRIWDIVCGEEALCRAIAGNRSATPGYELLCREAIAFYESRGLLGEYAEYLGRKKRHEEICALKETYDWAPESLKFVAYYAAALFACDEAAALAYARDLTGEAYVNVVLLFSRQRSKDGVQKLRRLSTEKRRVTDLILRMVYDPDMRLGREAEKCGPADQAALQKLLYSRVHDPAAQIALREAYGDSVAENEYVADWMKREKDGPGKIPAAEWETEREAQELYADCTYEEELRGELSLKEYEGGADPQEQRRILELYEGLGPDVRENAEYRKELLGRLVSLAAARRDDAAHREYRILLGVVLYYCNETTNEVKSREILYEAVSFLDPSAKRSTVELVRKAVCEAAGSFRCVEEIAAEKEKLVKALGDVQKIRMAKEYAVFYQRMTRNAQTIADIMASADLPQKIARYQELSDALRTSVARSGGSPLFGQAYTGWYRILQEELVKLSGGAVLALEVETTQCAQRGRICCVLRNLGRQPAEHITVRAIFEDAVRCRDGEKEWNILYGGDTCAFSFSIRCRAEGTQKYRLELSYGVAQSAKQAAYSREIRIGREAEHTHIGNLYSVAPVTSDAEFYGREREKKEILSFLNDVRYNTSMVMHGLKRVGKTSMLRYIERTMQGSARYLPVYKSAQGIGEQNAVGRMFVETVLEELEASGLADDMCRGYLKYDYDCNPDRLYDFYRYLQNSGLLGEKRILFMADEIEEMFDLVDEGRVSPRFYKVLRVILQELTSVRFIFCGADQLTDILYNHALADVFEITKRVVIGRLDEDAMQRMIVEPAAGKFRYTDRAVERVWHYTGGHTFYSKHICSKVIDLLNEENRETACACDIDTAVRQVMRITEYFIYLGRFFRENDRRVIRLMCGHTRYAKDRVPLEVLQEEYEGSGLSDSLAELEFKDILEKTEGYDADYYQFSIEMFRLWYAKAEYV